MTAPVEQPKPKRKYTKRKGKEDNKPTKKRQRPAREYEVFEEGHFRIASFKNPFKIEVRQGSTWGNPRTWERAKVSWSSPGIVSVAEAVVFSNDLLEACALAMAWDTERAGKPVSAFKISLTPAPA